MVLYVSKTAETLVSIVQLQDILIDMCFVILIEEKYRMF